MNKPRYIHGDAQKELRKLPASSADLIICDPPYGKGIDAWDKWPDDLSYYAFMRGIVGQLQRVLKPQGSLYLFCSPDRAAEVTAIVGESFNVLNLIRWNKGAGWHKKLDVDRRRKFVSNWEGIIFAEQRGADVRNVRQKIWGSYLAKAAKRQKIPTRRIQRLFLTKNGNLASVWSNWVNGRNMPSATQYAKLRRVLKLARTWRELQAEYRSHLRYFNPEYVAVDSLDFPPVHPTKRQHSCQKPDDLLAFLINASSKPGGVILDPFMGSGAVAMAAKRLRRSYIGIDKTALTRIR